MRAYILISLSRFKMMSCNFEAIPKVPYWGIPSRTKFEIIVNTPWFMIDHLPILYVKGGAGVFMKIFRKSTFYCFLKKEIDIFQMLLVPWKNIVPSRSFYWSKVSTFQSPVLKNELQKLSSPTVFEQSPSNFQDMFYRLI